MLSGRRQRLESPAAAAPGEEEIAAGQAVYSPSLLKKYDLLVHGFSNHLLWRCPTRHLLALYDENLSDTHLDVGVGTGYFLHRARFWMADPDITLLDLNPSCLAYAAKRICRYVPKTVVADVFKPLPDLGPFKSISLTYLLHCLPGLLIDKAIVLDRLADLAAPGAVLFGATLLQGDVPRNWGARRLMAFYNAKGIFSNEGDCLADLKEILNSRFKDVRVTLRGCVGLFVAWV